MQHCEELLPEQQRKLEKALAHLEYSYQKVQTLPTEVEALDDETLETWESFATRFARLTDIFLSRYLRTRVLAEDPGFTGTLRDFLNQGEKLGVLDDAHRWMGIRELRNITAHEYSENDLGHYFKRLLEESPHVIAVIQDATK